MKRASKFNSDHAKDVCSITMRKTRSGELFYYVEYFHSLDHGVLGFRCDRLETAIDIIKNNIE